MNLTRALAPAASTKTRARGAQYFSSGAVVHFDPQQSMAYAVVRGTEDYVVRIEIAGQAIRCTCTCPYFNDRLEPCKHLWAVALTCDDRGVLQPPDTIGPVGIGFVAVPLDEPDSDDWAVDDPEFRTPGSRSPARSSRPHGARSSPWLQALAAITAAAGADLRAPGPRAGPAALCNRPRGIETGRHAAGAPSQAGAEAERRVGGPEGGADQHRAGSVSAGPGPHDSRACGGRQPRVRRGPGAEAALTSPRHSTCAGHWLATCCQSSAPLAAAGSH